MEKPATETIYLGAGCFWCTEAVYDDVEGVQKVTSGYMGGPAAQANYNAVCSGNTGHAEVVEVNYDPKVLSTQKLLDIFFAIHDFTQLNRQGHDIGTQYRSAIYTTSPEQYHVAEQAIAQKKAEGYDIKTKLEPAEPFYPAEPYHQEYFKKNPSQAYCQLSIPPKLKKRDEVLAKTP